MNFKEKEDGENEAKKGRKRRRQKKNGNILKRKCHSENYKPQNVYFP